mgnify:CR=1 FL=1
MDTKRATSREIQRSIFSDSLFRELEMMERNAGSRNYRLAAKAMEYQDDGLEPDEIVDMLILDGFPAELSREHVMACAAASQIDTQGDLWDFLYEDANGKIWRGSQMDMTVTGETREEAMSNAADLIASGDIQLERIVDAERITED